MSNDFAQAKCKLLKGFLDVQSVQTISKYMEHSLRQNRQDSTDDESSLYKTYADPLIEVVLENVKDDVQLATGLDLIPTYSYSRVYVQGDELKPHVDRPSCEVSVTVHVATKGAPWPIWMKVPGKEPQMYVLEPGDAVVYRGCEVVHWREKAIETEVNAQFMLHYVDANGPYTAFKWDKRPSIGLPANSRRM